MTVGGDILSFAPSGTGIVVVGTVTIGGGTATVTASPTKKSGGAKSLKGSVGLLCLQASLILGVFLAY